MPDWEMLGEQAQAAAYMDPFEDGEELACPLNPDGPCEVCD